MSCNCGKNNNKFQEMLYKKQLAEQARLKEEAKKKKKNERNP